MRTDSILKCYYFTSELTNGDTIFDSSLFRYLQDETAGTNVKKHCSEIGQNTRHYTKDDPNYVSMGCWLNPTFTWLEEKAKENRQEDWINKCSEFKNYGYGYVPYSGTRNRNRRQQNIYDIYKNDNNFIKSEMERVKRERAKKKEKSRKSP